MFVAQSETRADESFTSYVKARLSTIETDANRKYKKRMQHQRIGPIKFYKNSLKCLDRGRSGVCVIDGNFSNENTGTIFVIMVSTEDACQNSKRKISVSILTSTEC
jgi:hypothetical protein